MSFEIASAYVDLSMKGVDTVKQGVGGVKGILSNLGIGPSTLGIVGIGAAIGFSVKKAMDWEQHATALRSKLSAMGEDAETAAGKIDHLAKAIGKTTSESAGHVKALVMQAMNMGATSEEAQKLAATAVGMGKATGKGPEEVLEGLVKIQHGMRSSLDKSIPAMAGAATQQEKLALAAKLAAQGYKQFGSEGQTAENQLDQVQKSIAGLYTDLGKQFLPAVKVCIAAVRDFVDWIKSTISVVTEFAGSSDKAAAGFQSSWGQVAECFQAVGTVIGQVCNWVVRQFLLIPAYGELIGISLANLFLNLAPAYLTAFGRNFVVLCSWIWDNWREILATLWNYLRAGFLNVIDNIKKFWLGLFDFIRGKGWKVDWTPLAAGAVNEIKKMPEFVKAATDPAWDQMQREALAKVTKQGEAIQGLQTKYAMTATKREEQEKTAGKEIADMVSEGLSPLENLREKKGKSGGGGFEGVLDVWKRAQTSLMKTSAEKEHLNVSKQQLAEQKEQKQLLRQISQRSGGKSLSLAK